jgi:hypothetical protein
MHCTLCFHSCHLRFAAIKEAICSPKQGSSSSNILQQQQEPLPPSCPIGSTEDPCTPPPSKTHASRTLLQTEQQQQQQQQRSSLACSPFHSTPVSLSGPGGPGGPRTSSSDLATAVAAVLSPRANAAQTEALVGLFGGRSPIGRRHRSANGSVDGDALQQHSSTDWGTDARCGLAGRLGGKSSSVRRMTWSAADEHVGAQAAAAGGGSVRSVGGGMLKTSEGASVLDSCSLKVRGLQCGLMESKACSAASMTVFCAAGLTPCSGVEASMLPVLLTYCDEAIIKHKLCVDLTLPIFMLWFAPARPGHVLC